MPTKLNSYVADRSWSSRWKLILLKAFHRLLVAILKSSIYSKAALQDSHKGVDLLIFRLVKLLEMDVFPSEGDFKYVSFFESHLLGVGSTN
jgi:hypothetical protein